MKLSEVIHTAARSMSGNRLRTGLSILGIVIGVASVITLVSVGTGAQRQVTDQISSLGSNLINISAAPTRGFGGRVSRSDPVSLTYALGEEIAAASPSTVRVLPQRTSSGLLLHGGVNVRATLVGVTPDYPEVMNYPLLVGRFVHPWDMESNAFTMVLGSEVAKDLFGSALPLGEQVTVSAGGRRLRFTVIGVMEPKGQVLFSNFDNQVYIPITTLLYRILGTDTVSGYAAQALDSDHAQTAVEEVSYFLSRRFGGSNRFNVSSQESILTAISSAIGTFTLMLGAIAGISLLVGGIGIMNIMLVSVSERTREIGIRKALGARRRDILTQFLAEAVALSGAGGAIGLLIGWSGSVAIARFAGWPAAVSSGAVALAIGFSITVGLVFGVYPATRAARLDPVVALRHE